MKSAPFIHHQARSADHAVAMLADLASEGGRILAGGQSLIPMMAFRLAQPAHLIDINRIPGLAEVNARNGTLSIGALARHAAFHRPVCDGPTGALLSEISRYIAHYPIRTRGTFCGSIAHADPSSEWCLVLATLGGSLLLRAATGAREVPAEEFFQGIMATAAGEQELLAEVRLTQLPEDSRFGFYEHSRRAGDYALSMTLVVYSLQAGRMRGVRVGVGGAEPNPRRLRQVEALLENAAPDPALFAHAADAAAAGIAAMEDHQVSAALRRDMLRATTLRALRRAAA
jgi:carbon-monoxide dehydrogenase medium subunit